MNEKYRWPLSNYRYDSIARWNNAFGLEKMMQVYAIEFLTDPISTPNRPPVTTAVSRKILRITVADDFKETIPHSVMPFIPPKPANI